MQFLCQTKPVMLPRSFDLLRFTNYGSGQISDRFRIGIHMITRYNTVTNQVNNLRKFLL